MCGAPLGLWVRVVRKGQTMKINQLSVFLENKPGKLSVPCKALTDAGLNILTLSLADTHQFGILRLILQDWEKAKDVLEKAGCVVNVTEVVALEVPDKPGGLTQVLDVVEKAEINLEYMYAFTFRKGDRAVLVFRFESPDDAIAAMREAGIQVVDGVDVFERE
jgi:hypothetical protein